MVAVEFNDRPVPWDSAAPGRLVVELPVLEGRNLATIEIAVAEAPGAWGGVTLVFGGEVGSG